VRWHCAARARALEPTLIRRVADAVPRGAIDLGLGQPDLPTPPGIGLAGIEAIAAGRTGYTTPAGDPRLREEVARRYPAIGAAADGVMVTAGSQEGVFVACLGLVDPGGEVLVPDPGYPAYPTVVRLVGGVPVSYPLRAEAGFRLRAADVESRLGPRTALVILNAPSNPTGAAHAAGELRPLLATLEARAIPWLSDEVYGAFRYAGEEIAPWHCAPSGGVVVSGLSKEAGMTGWRVGWIVGPSPVIARLIAVHQHVLTCAPSMSQAAALRALSPQGALDRERFVARFRRRRELMAEALSRVPDVAFGLPDGAFYFFVDVRAHGRSAEVARRLLERQRVVVVPGEAFGPGGEGWLRLSFAAPEQAIVEGVRRMGRELAGGAPI
jgi:aspartate/methionine/tyrosine aminotransferase